MTEDLGTCLVHVLFFHIYSRITNDFYVLTYFWKLYAFGSSSYIYYIHYNINANIRNQKLSNLEIYLVQIMGTSLLRYCEIHI